MYKFLGGGATSSGRSESGASYSMVVRQGLSDCSIHRTSYPKWGAKIHQFERNLGLLVKFCNLPIFEVWECPKV